MPLRLQSRSSPRIELYSLAKSEGRCLEIKIYLTDRGFCLKERYGEKNGFFYGVGTAGCCTLLNGWALATPMDELLDLQQQQGCESVPEKDSDKSYI
jgi:hypothetical protein